MSTTAVILAAGVGSRLRPLTDRLPKCLLTLGAETILGRAVRLLAEAGVDGLVVATGFQAELVEGALARSPLPVRFVANPDHATTQNVVSLHRALGAVTTGAVIKLDGDVVFAPEVLRRLMAGEPAGGEAQVAVDSARAPDAEAMKVTARDGWASHFGKGLDPARSAGESIGIERFGDGARGELAAALGRAVAAGRTQVYYEDVYNDLLAAGLAMRCVPVGDLPWTEVDAPADLALARRMVADGL